uniref:AC transposase n=1 Tax=Cajanus cajan TaxID=3821 RepID=A0A151S1R3_CAJCA|nr:Putative AC transposase [Cajanus cajan]
MESFKNLLDESVEVNNDVEQNNISANEEDELGESKMPVKRCRSLSASVWSYFEKPIKHPDGKMRAKCKYCKKDLVGGGSLSDTSTLIRHMKRCENRPKTFADFDVGKLVLDHSEKIRSRIIDQNVLNDMISMMIIEHDLPYSFVECKRFRELIEYLHPDVKIPSRRVATSNINKMYECEKEKLKLVLSKLPGRINLTSDVWTSCTTEGYISLTTHYVDQNWKLHSKMLNFSHFPKIIYGFLEDWGIETKIFSLTLDNASSNDKMQDYLKERLLLQNDGLLCGDEFFHIRCVAHILNLIVQEEFIQYENDNLSHVGKSQLDTYLEEQKHSSQYHLNLDLLQYWMENKVRFPELALMAYDILSIQITIVASESAFSIGSRVLNKYRTSLLAENVQALIYTRN